MHYPVRMSIIGQPASLRVCTSFSSSLRILSKNHSLGLQPRHYSITLSNLQPPADQPPILHSILPAPHTGTIHILALNSPSSRNAISLSLLSHLSTYLQTTFPPDSLGSPLPTSTLPTTPRALILTSAHPTTAFCAGANLRERATFTPQQTAEFLKNLRGTLTHLSNLLIPTISSISSMALGGGAEIALATDFRFVGTTKGVLGLPETRLGIIPGAGGTYRLKRLVGEAKALELILSGRRVSAHEAEGMGLVTRAVEDGDSAGSEVAGVDGEIIEQLRRDIGEEVARDRTLLESVAFAREICQGGPIAVLAAKRAVKGGCEEAENQAYQGLVRTRDRDEALLAFKEKRKAVFRGE